MPPIVKENETLTAAPDMSAGGDAAAKQQPVALEVAVTVNGARTIDGSDKREPFSETTKTVLVFGNGAVIRLTSSVAPGQLLFLTNERTKKEVVCQVVKSKNYRNVSGYVELEFTEPVVGFWGMRFPGDRIGAAPAPTPVAAPPAAVSSPVPSRPVAPAVVPSVSTTATKPATPLTRLPSPSTTLRDTSIVPPPMDSAALLGTEKPKAPAAIPAPPAPAIVPPPAMNPPVAAMPPVPKEPIAPVAPVLPTATTAVPTSPASLMPTTPNFDSPRQADAPASFLAPAQAPRVPSTIDLSSLAPFFDVKPTPTSAAPPAPPAAPVVADPETEALKQHTARLQEQLSSMLFAEAQPAPPANPTPVIPTAPVQDKKELQESIAQVLEMAKPAAPRVEPVLAAPVEPARSAPEKRTSSLEDEELKIPAWLEPLARNASAPSSTQELVLREKAKRMTEPTTEEAAEAESPAPPFFPAVAPHDEGVSEPHVPQFGSALVIDEDKPTVVAAGKNSGKGMLWIGIAAGILVAAGGGWWFMNQSGSHPPASAAAASTSSPAVEVPAKPQASAPAPTSVAQTEAPVSRSGQSESNSVAQSNPAPNSNAAATPPLSVVSSRTIQPAPSTSNKGGASANSRPVQPPAEEEVKKASLGSVHLAAPKLSQNRASQGSADADPTLSLEAGQTGNNSDALGAGLSVSGKQPVAPAAPMPVGGDVKQAKLISRVDPIYPPLAKQQHVSGNVSIDALIDANGKVTTMKVISGPTLLHQAAMDALRQWKYQPAMLDGKAVSMHLTVTMQFRPQQ